LAIDVPKTTAPCLVNELKMWAIPVLTETAKVKYMLSPCPPQCLTVDCVETIYQYLNNGPRVDEILTQVEGATYPSDLDLPQLRLLLGL
jgi:hypothetical protein